MDKDWNLKKLYKAVDNIIIQGVGLPQQPQQIPQQPNIVKALDELAKQRRQPVTTPESGLPKLPEIS